MQQYAIKKCTYNTQEMVVEKALQSPMAVQ